VLSRHVPGSTITSQFIVFSAFTTLVSGNARWICSPSESVLETKSEGGGPWEKSSGLAMSIRTFPARLSLPADSSIAIEPSPLVAFTISSAPAAASPAVSRRSSGYASRQTANGGFPR
jgi:hypothetical protein